MNLVFVSMENSLKSNPPTKLSTFLIESIMSAKKSEGFRSSVFMRICIIYICHFLKYVVYKIYFEQFF
jgi:hypothetical protein